MHNANQDHILLTESEDTRHGAQNAYDAASKQTLENEFGTDNEDECMIKILEGGTLQETEVGGEHYEATRAVLTD